MYTVEQIYNRLSGGGNATKMPAFTEPLASPNSGTMHTLDDIYALAWPARVPKTGQTTSYAARDDGDLEKGVAWPNPRFTDNANGTVTDNLTGLMWMKNANVRSDCAGTAELPVNWATALASAAACNAGAGYAGQTDWRLPSNREMLSLIHYGFTGPAVPNTAGTGKWTAGNPFSDLQLGWYWTSTTFVATPSSAWVVYMSDGEVDLAAKTFVHNVWLVRGGP